MVDPLSITGLTIAVLEQLWKLGERTAELVSDFRDFDNVSLPSSLLLPIHLTLSLIFVAGD